MSFDSNDREQTEIVKDLLERLRIDLDLEEAVSRLENSRLMDITEYGRAVHAEMDALLACARTGTSPVGGILFTTTFPCHNCARHILAAGIKRVVYIAVSEEHGFNPTSRCDLAHRNWTEPQ